LRAFVDVDFTVLSGVAFWALAGVVVDAISALSTVLARTCGLQSTSSTASTLSGERIGRWLWCKYLWHFNDALVNVDFAIVAGKSRFAIADVLVDKIFTFASVLAWLCSALIDVDFAILSCESREALARIGSDVINAISAVLARSISAIVDVVFTMFTVEAF
jgi:hypothetical protein